MTEVALRTPACRLLSETSLHLRPGSTLLLRTSGHKEPLVGLEQEMDVVSKPPTGNMMKEILSAIYHWYSNIHQLKTKCTF